MVDNDTIKDLFMIACKHNNIETMIFMCEKGLLKNIDFTQEILKDSTDINEMDDTTYILIKFLLERKLIEDINKQQEFGSTLLHSLCEKPNCYELFKLLLEKYCYDIDPNIVNNYGNTPIIRLIRLRRYKHLELLFKAKLRKQINKKFLNDLDVYHINIYKNDETLKKIINNFLIRK